MILGWWDIPLGLAAVYIGGIWVWSKAQERGPWPRWDGSWPEGREDRNARRDRQRRGYR